MALELNIISYQCSGVGGGVAGAGGHKPGERIAKATFRGVSHLSKTFEDQGDRASRVSQVSWEIHNAPSCLTRIEGVLQGDKSVLDMGWVVGSCSSKLRPRLTY